MSLSHLATPGPASAQLVFCGIWGQCLARSEQAAATVTASEGTAHGVLHTGQGLNSQEGAHHAHRPGSCRKFRFLPVLLFGSEEQAQAAVSWGPNVISDGAHDGLSPWAPLGMQLLLQRLS